MSRLTLSTDDDLLKYFPRLDDIWPRKNSDGSARHPWGEFHAQAAEYIERYLRATKSVPERFLLGRLSPRSMKDLKEAASCLALSFIFVAADIQGDDSGMYHQKAKYFEKRGLASLKDAALLLDYDTDGSGNIDASEAQQPFPVRLIRG